MGEGRKEGVLVQCGEGRILIVVGARVRVCTRTRIRIRAVNVDSIVGNAVCRQQEIDRVKRGAVANASVSAAAGHVALPPQALRAYHPRRNLRRRR